MFKKLQNINISLKIVIAMMILFIGSKSILTYYATMQMESLAKESSKKSLHMVTEAIFLSLRVAMNTGDTDIIYNAEKEASKINGVVGLNIAQSKKIIELFANSKEYTKDKDILSVFKLKQEKLFDVYDKDKHHIRFIKPMIATNECIVCHSNQNIGDVIGVIDLTFSLNKEDNRIHEASSLLMIISIIVIVLSVIIIYYIVKKATDPIHEFQVGLDNFFKYLNKETNSIQTMKVHSMDEVGQMVSAVNANIKQTLINIESDDKFIDEVKSSVEEMIKGYFNHNIENTPNTPALRELKELINQVVEYVEKNVGQDINKILNVLDSYSNHDYTNTIDVKKGKVSISLNELKNTINEMLLSNKRLGLILQQNSNLLTTNVDILKGSADTQTIHLKETAAQIRIITTNLNNTSQKTISMTELANEVKRSTDNGKKLAEDSANSMNEINRQTSEITEAITIIDQIAFQTNILSLNAAVEAATAGEAGKGFAVVAQEVRNLANRSAEAAKTIKELVNQATQKSNDGKIASDKMIEGYSELNEKINQTIDLISDVATNSKEQIVVINTLNSSMQSLNTSTEQNSKVANETNEIAVETNIIAKDIVKQTDKQNFDGKDSIVIRKEIFNDNWPQDKEKRQKHYKENKTT